MINSSFWKGKKVLVTGHTGFKGSWLSIWLNYLGADVIGYSLDHKTEKDNYVLSNIESKIIDLRGDIRDEKLLTEVFNKYSPDIVFHLAAQPLVRESYEIPKETYEVNLIGTINILEAIRKYKNPVVGIFITTDKCYENKEQLWGYRETDALGGFDPYSSSKGCCEIAIDSWRRSFFNPINYDIHKKAIASVRAGNVIGGGDWSKDRLIPDCIRYIESNKDITIRNPDSVRPWQHVLEPLGGYIILAEKMYQCSKKYCEAWNFGPDIESIITTKNIVSKFISFYGTTSKLNILKSDNLHEANLLSLDTTKAKTKLKWKPVFTIDDTLKLTIDWYRNYKNNDVYNICINQIDKYMSLIGDL